MQDERELLFFNVWILVPAELPRAHLCKGTVEQWPDADKVDFLRHLPDLTEDQSLSPRRGIRYSWANGALNLLISLDPSLDRTGLFRFISSRRTQHS